MMLTAVTLIGHSPTLALETRAIDIVRNLGAEIAAIDMLDPACAMDIKVKGNSPPLLCALRKAFESFGHYDIFIQPQDEFRRKRLLVADMDATIVKQETLDELAALAGVREKVSPITEKAMRGEIDFAAALAQRVALLKGFPLQKVYEAAEKVEYSEGAALLVKTMRRHGARCVLVSGGFDIFTAHVAETLGFHSHFSNRLATDGATLSGAVIPPILDKEAKARILTEEAKKLPCPPAGVIAVGDGANDIPMLQKAGAGIGYFAKPAVQAITPHHVRYSNLAALLYMQGYEKKDLAF